MRVLPASSVRCADGVEGGGLDGASASHERSAMNHGFHGRAARLRSVAMDLPAWLRCSSSVKFLAAIGLLALVVCGSALAKFSISIATSDTTPAVAQRVILVVQSGQVLDYDLRLIAVAPGQPVFRVVATITGDTSRPDPDVARHGFEIDLKRIAPNRWRGVTRFPRPGRWRVVVPNGAPVGVIIPNGAALLVLAVH
jgi:hypothetical protein